MSLFDWLPFGKKKKESIDPELARQMLTDRYNSFRMLIQANTRMHEYVAELEEALRGYTPYGMHYVRAQCTRISVSTYQMIKYLNELKPDGYLKLYDRFEEIQERIAEHIDPVHLTGEGDLVLNLKEVGREQIDLCGPKWHCLVKQGPSLI